MKYTVAYTVLKVNEDIIEAESEDEAVAKWEAMGYDAELFFVRNMETGHETVFN